MNLDVKFQNSLFSRFAGVLQQTQWQQNFTTSIDNDTCRSVWWGAIYQINKIPD